MLESAQAQIASLQSLLDQKAKTIQSYQELLAKQQEAFAAEKAKDQQELQRLHERLMNGALYPFSFITE
jgi:predicted  nucleic acid-binding Zn-ribbon protein